MLRGDLSSDGRWNTNDDGTSGASGGSGSSEGSGSSGSGGMSGGPQETGKHE